MKTIYKITLLSLFASSNLLANPIDTIGLNLGVSNTLYSQEDKKGSITLGNTPDESFNTYEIYTTLNPILDICKEYNMKPYISYTYSSNTELKHQYILVGLNKYYKPTNTQLELYAGALVGYGELQWKYNPINSSKDNDVDANSFIGGIQLGVDYPISNSISLGLNSKYLIHNYETNLNPTNTAISTITHDSTASLSFGVTYRF